MTDDCVLFCDLPAARVCLAGRPASRAELFQALAAGLCLPGGPATWDDLSDQLQDLSWLKERQALIVHEGLGGLSNDERDIYLDILAGACAWWEARKEKGGKRLCLVLPQAERERFLERVREARDMLASG